MITSVMLRGKEIEVDYTDHGYEPDTNAHDIDWYLLDPALQESLTSDEMDSIDGQVRENAWQRAAYGHDDDDREIEHNGLTHGYD